MECGGATTKTGRGGGAKSDGGEKSLVVFSENSLRRIRPAIAAPLVPSEIVTVADLIAALSLHDRGTRVAIGWGDGAAYTVGTVRAAETVSELALVVIGRERRMDEVVVRAPEPVRDPDGPRYRDRGRYFHGRRRKGPS